MPQDESDNWRGRIVSLASLFWELLLLSRKLSVESNNSGVFTRQDFWAVKSSNFSLDIKTMLKKNKLEKFQENF